MQPLNRDSRRKLEGAVKEAREVAERAAHAALEQLGVGASKPAAWLTPEQRDLRRRLRAHGRGLGDVRNAATEAQTVELLAEEVAYQHWHRMLFARFLAENGLLMYPDPLTPVPVTLADCAELAPGEGVADAWELAARYASHMLPQIFRPTSPVFELALPPEHQQALERLVERLDAEVFSAGDGLGWVYQFWQSKKKEQVNDSEVKIGAAELPAVTQLFTEPYMVSFLLDNALGAWWVGRVTRCDDPAAPELRPGARAILRTAASEEELRAFFALPGAPLAYLRFVRGEDGDGRKAWRPAAGWFEGWPHDLGAFKLLDPCCGSGHFLVAALPMLAAMRRDLEGLTPAAAVDAVLRQNIHGLEIDERCVEIAAFTLALAAWRYEGAGGYRKLPPLNLACSGLAIGASKAEWLALAQAAADEIVAEQAPALLPEAGKESLWHTQLKAGMSALYDLFADAPVLGSLINPHRVAGDFFRADYGQVAALLRQTLAGNSPVSEQYEMGVVAQGLAQAAALLADKYDWVVTNVPYLAASRQHDVLQSFIAQQFATAKNDLATAFLKRSLELTESSGVVCAVTPQSWLFLNPYKRFRIECIDHFTFGFVAQLGSQAFEAISGEVVNVALVALANDYPSATSSLFGVDLSGVPLSHKSALLASHQTGHLFLQCDLHKNPDSRIILRTNGQQHLDLLSSRANSYKGIATGDLNRFVRFCWEQPINDGAWAFIQSTGNNGELYCGLEQVVFWQNGNGDLFKFVSDKLGTNGVGAWLRGEDAWGKNGIAVSQMSLSASSYLGTLFDENTAVVVPKSSNDLLPILAMYQSSWFVDEIRKIDSSLKVPNLTLLKIPFDLAHWTQVAAEKYPDGLPKPYSTYPTQWIFHGHPADSDAPLQVAVARLLGYRWPAELDPSMELSGTARSWVGAAGALLPFADKDGIVCLPALRGEFSAAERVTALLAAAYGPRWHGGMLNELLASAGWAGKTLDSYLADRFFADHCHLFHQRPFIWHVWDGLPDGFGALVNYHRLDRKNLETLIYNYLGDWINRQKQEIAGGVDGAQTRLAAAETLKRRLEMILHGEAPYDIFVRWKAPAQQPLGWEPDLNDGVRLNIRPFLSVPDVGKRGTGVLRDKPNINWNKDRGQDVASAPWYGVFRGERINDYHLSLAEKQAARERARAAGETAGG